MAFNWEEYLDLARQLCGQECTVTTEAMLRSAVSRAYYAAFCFARKYAEDKMGFIPSENSDEHGRVIRHFEDYGRRTNVAKHLKEMRLWRNKCDYKENAVISELLATNAITRAKLVIDMLKV